MVSQVWPPPAGAQEVTIDAMPYIDQAVFSDHSVRGGTASRLSGATVKLSGTHDDRGRVGHPDDDRDTAITGKLDFSALPPFVSFGVTKIAVRTTVSGYSWYQSSETFDLFASGQILTGYVLPSGEVDVYPSLYYGEFPRRWTIPESIAPYGEWIPAFVSDLGHDDYGFNEYSGPNPASGVSVTEIYTGIEWGVRDGDYLYSPDLRIGAMGRVEWQDFLVPCAIDTTVTIEELYFTGYDYAFTQKFWTGFNATQETEL